MHELKHTLSVLLKAVIYEVLNCFHYFLSSPSFATVKLSFKLCRAHQHELLLCHMLHINYTTDNICDSLKIEVKEVDTKYLFVQQNSKRSSSTERHVVSLIPPGKNRQISRYSSTFRFQILCISSVRLKMFKADVDICFSCFIIHLNLCLKHRRF